MALNFFFHEYPSFSPCQVLSIHPENKMQYTSFSETVKELLKSDSICQSYAQMKKGPVFFWLTVYLL